MFTSSSVCVDPKLKSIHSSTKMKSAVVRAGYAYYCDTYRRHWKVGLNLHSGLNYTLIYMFAILQSDFTCKMAKIANWTPIQTLTRIVRNWPKLCVDFHAVRHSSQCRWWGQQSVSMKKWSHILHKPPNHHGPCRLNLVDSHTASKLDATSSADPRCR